MTTKGESVTPIQVVLDPYHPMFMMRMIISGRWVYLFGDDPDAEFNDSFFQKMYIMKKRLFCSYEEFMLMDPEDRDFLYRQEMKLIEQERENSTGRKKL